MEPSSSSSPSTSTWSTLGLDAASNYLPVDDAAVAVETTTAAAAATEHSNGNTNSELSPPPFVSSPQPQSGMSGIDCVTNKLHNYDINTEQDGNEDANDKKMNISSHHHHASENAESDNGASSSCCARTTPVQAVLSDGPSLPPPPPLPLTTSNDNDNDDDGTSIQAASSLECADTATNDDNDDDDVLLSYHCPRYKEVLYNAFRNLGLRASKEVENRVAKEVLHTLQTRRDARAACGGSSGGGDDGMNHDEGGEIIIKRRLVMRSNRSRHNLEEVDDEKALKKIHRDIRMRKEVRKTWNAWHNSQCNIPQSKMNRGRNSSSTVKPAGDVSLKARSEQLDNGGDAGVEKLEIRAKPAPVMREGGEYEDNNIDNSDLSLVSSSYGISNIDSVANNVDEQDKDGDGNNNNNSRSSSSNSHSNSEDADNAASSTPVQVPDVDAATAPSHPLTTSNNDNDNDDERTSTHAASSSECADTTGDDNSSMDVILSHRFPRYKEIMHHAFRKLGLDSSRDVANRVADEVLHTLLTGKEALAGKGGGTNHDEGGGKIVKRRFLISLNRSSHDLEEVNNEKALEKIRKDIYRRRESQKKWLLPHDNTSQSTKSLGGESSSTFSKSSKLVGDNSSEKMGELLDNADSGADYDAGDAKLRNRVDEIEDRRTSRTTKRKRTQSSVEVENDISKLRIRKSGTFKTVDTLVDSQERCSNIVDVETTAALLAAYRNWVDELLTGLPDTPTGDYYEEESAWRFYNPKLPETETVSKKMVPTEKLTELREGAALSSLIPVSPDDLSPLPPAAPLPPLPNTGFCDWSFEEKSRVLLADFRVPSREGEDEMCEIKVVREDEEFLFTMMERDDITVISQGLADEMDSSLLSREYIDGIIGSVYHHKIRGFETMFREDGTLSEQTREKEGWYSMKISDYHEYLQRRSSAKQSLLGIGSTGNGDLMKEFTFVDSDGNATTIDVDSEALYLVDVDVVKLLPELLDDLQQNFKLPGILPGGSHCMMSAVNASGRPFMGPNLYVTPPASFTHFHQDGHGTVDSGHLCLSGYNEVVMLRRLTERHKCHAIQLLTGTSTFLDTLYGLPHRSQKSQPGWPNNESIEQCRKMGYYPSVFILKPGQVVHINKGRLHAFRKMAPSQLPEIDCHYGLRTSLLSSKQELTEEICCSIAWDWMFKGVTSEGINREISSVLECSRLNRQHDLQSLAIPETTLLFLAKKNITLHEVLSGHIATSYPFSTSSRRCDRFAPDAMTVLRGILPSLQYVVNRHSSWVTSCKRWAEETRLDEDSLSVSIDPKPNTQQDPSSFALDPYGAGDFFCKFCFEELSNVYMHCDGCEKLLSKDFNICCSCHAEGRYKVFHQMHPFNDKKVSILNHTGNKTGLRRAKCPCRNGRECGYCSYCTGCSCRCHQCFTVHYRFMGLEDELSILEMAESIVGSNTISQAAETRARLLSLIPPSAPPSETADIRTEPETIDLCLGISGDST